jgi:hypothetical protein
MSVLLQAGRHVLEVEEPDLVIYRVRGVITGDELQAMREAQAGWVAGMDPIVVLIDLSEMEGATREARKAAMHFDGGPTRRAIAYFGSRFAVRVMVELTLRAMRVLRPRAYPMRFCEDEASARLWLDAQRAELLRQT